MIIKTILRLNCNHLFARCKIINSTGGEGAIIGLELNGDAKRVIKFIGILTLQMSLINVV